MATLTTQIIDDNVGGVVVAAFIDGGGGNLSSAVLADITTLSPVPVSLSLLRVSYSFTSFSALLQWEANVNDPLLHLAASTYGFDWSGFKGLTNPQSTGFTGNIIISTSGLGGQDSGSVVLELLKS